MRHPPRRSRATDEGRQAGRDDTACHGGRRATLRPFGSCCAVSLTDSDTLSQGEMEAVGINVQY